MKSTLKLALLAFFVLLALGLVWSALKVMELGSSGPSGEKPAGAWTHPLAQLDSWTLRRPSQCADPELFKQEVADSPKGQIWFLDVQSQKNNWVLLCENASSSKLFQQWKEGLDFNPLIPFLEAQTNHFFIFNLQSSQAEEAKDFARLTESLSNSDRMGAMSPSRIPVATLRKERPQWFFGADGTTWTKVLTLNSLGLRGLSDLWADFYILGQREQTALQNQKDLTEFMVQKNKVLIMEGVRPEELRLPYKGLLEVKE
ncbi:MAG: hypothetical protein GW917_02320 [Bdellovibrionales bacterium]|nr:hypothetical protein [Bdellovibrionales bacterium]